MNLAILAQTRPSHAIMSCSSTQHPKSCQSPRLEYEESIKTPKGPSNRSKAKSRHRPCHAYPPSDSNLSLRLSMTRKWSRKTHQLQWPFLDWLVCLPYRRLVYGACKLCQYRRLVGSTNQTYLKVKPTNKPLFILSSLSAISSSAFCLS
jgi:hypothetical protein